jgi:hypothetical protein
VVSCAALVAVAVLAVVLVRLSGSDDAGQPAGPGPAASAAAGEAPAASARPSATASGSAVIGAVDQVVVSFDTTPADAPPGWVPYADPTGWSVTYPATWERRAGPGGVGNVDFVDPLTGSFLRVGSIAKANRSAIEDWQKYEQTFGGQVRDYQRIRLEPSDGGSGSTQADWEFTYSTGGGKEHVLDRGAVRHGHGYALYWHTREDQWISDQPLRRQMYASFRPAP